MGYKGFQVLALDELEELEASAIQEIVAWHGFVHYIEDGCEISLLGDLLVVELVL